MVMDTNTKKEALEKLAKEGSVSKFLVPFSMLSKDSLLTYLTLAGALGAAGGAGLGIASSYVKGKDPKLLALSRKKEFYDRKVDELDNENWLNDVMDIRKKLESSKLSDEERTALEDKYVKLLNK